VQLARQAAGLEVTDRIELTFDGDASLLSAATAHESYIAGETLAVAVGYESLDGEGLDPVTIDGRELWLSVSLA
jgi:isoleucyl-tRNA synthetase